MTWQKLKPDARHLLKSGYILSATADLKAFLLEDVKTGSIVQTLPKKEFVDDLKYRYELLAEIAQRINFPIEGVNLFFDDKAEKLIEEICESNRRLF